jgi:nucleoside phosphorylase
MSTIVLVTALRLETRAVLGALTRVRRVRPADRPTWTGRVDAREITVVQGGVGPLAAELAAAAIPEDAALVGSVGFAGALDPALSPGDVVVPAAILWLEGARVDRYDVSPAICDALAGALDRALHRVVLFSSASILAGAVAKQTAFERHAAAAVEMEAAALARWARARPVPFFALRVVLDPAELSLEDLPPNLDSSWAARMRLATLPRSWPLLATLRRHAATAGAALTYALRAALPALPLRDAGAPSLPLVKADRIVHR